MTVSYALLGLLEEADRHGYDLKRSYDRRFGAAKPIRLGQVYRTLAQLVRDGLVEVVGVEAGAGPLLADYQLFHIEADLRWIDHAVGRLATLAEEVRDAPASGQS